MAYVNQPENPCMTCGKIGLFTCRGCSKLLCLQHTNEHRQFLEQQMNEVLGNYERVNQHVNDQTTTQYLYKLMEQIKQWEEESINKIQQSANQLREQLVASTQEYDDNMKENFALLTQQLTKAQQDGDYYEKDIIKWTDLLQRLQHILAEQQTIKIEQVNTKTPFITKIALTEKADDDIQQSIRFLEYRTNNNQSKYRAQAEYTSDVHFFRFILNQYQAGSKVFMGIVSKSTRQDTDPFRNPTFYGWASDNVVYLHGVPHSNYNNYRSDIENNDEFQLVLDCNRRLIRLINERTGRTYELNININKCPLPWQSHIRLFNHWK